MPDWFSRITTIWAMGGLTMIPLCILSLLIYISAVRLLLHCSRLDYRDVTDDLLRTWIQNPQSARAEIAEIIRFTQEEARSAGEIHNRFSEVFSARLPDIDRRLTFVNLLVTVAPLLGLLGTVLGMLLTFKALATAGGKLTEQMASGISQALFPPEVGLCVALPGMVLIHLIRRKRSEYEAFLARMESQVIQHFRRNSAKNRREAGHFAATNNQPPAAIHSPHA